MLTRVVSAREEECAGKFGGEVTRMIRSGFSPLWLPVRDAFFCLGRFQHFSFSFFLVEDASVE